MSTENRDPLPSSLCTATLPPSSSANFFASDSPRPVPRSRFCMRVSIWTKSENSAGRCSAAMPMPVSVTANSIIWPSMTRALTRTSPCGVNFSALEMKLRRICDSFLSSV